jgi:short-subunit dehydrogenase
MEIKNKIAIITGASGGIGLSVARLLSEKGATVVLAARSEDKLKTLMREIPNSHYIVTDMRRPDDVKNLVAKTKEKFGRIDILVNNAGQGLRAPLEKVDQAAYRDIMELNVFAVLNAMKEVIPVMRAQGGGTILNVSSMVSKNYFPGLSAYASTKYALNALSLTAREELKKDGIVVSLFHPKMTATDFGKNSAGLPYESRQGIATSAQGALNAPAMSALGRSTSASGRVDTPEAVAEKIVEQIESGEAESQM